MAEECIRVLHVITRMVRGGAESRLMDMYRNIDREKIQFDFYTCRKEANIFDDEILSYGGKIYYNNPITIKNYLKMPQKMYAFLKEHPEYKIVHCHLNQWCGVVLKGAKMAGVPVRIAHSRNSLTQLTLINICRNFIKKSVNRFATHKMAVSAEAAKWLYGKKANEAIIFPNAINAEKYRFDTEERVEARRELGIGEEKLVMHVGNMKTQKNHGFLLKVFAEMLKKDSTVKLALVGDGELRGSLEQECKALGIENSVRFLGVRGDVNKMLQAADIFVFPSFYEGFPGAVLEAETSGLPCLISDTVTKEVCLGDNVRYKSIKDDPEKWADEAFEMMKSERTCRFEKVKSLGYDIKSATKIWEEFYAKEYEKIK